MQRFRMCFYALAYLFLFLSQDAALAEINVYDCEFKGLGPLVITSYENDKSARIGIEQGIGDKAQSYYDTITTAWIFVEFYSGDSYLIHSQQY